MMNFLLCALLGYLIGSVNPAYILGVLKGVDIREKGSGNAGASNVVILFGKLRGALCAVVDIAKAYLVIRIAQILLPKYAFSFAVTSTACILGHIFPFYMHFRGGKGLACLGGVVLAYDWRVLLGMLALEIVILFVTDYLCFVPITASFIFPAVYGCMAGDLLGALILLVPALVMLYRHMENLCRIRQGTEMHISYLWNPDAEMKRIQSNLDEEPAAIEEHFCVK